MLTCYSNATESPTPIYVVHSADYPEWIAKQSDPLRSWAQRVGYQAKTGEICIVPTAEGGIFAVLLGTADRKDAMLLGI
jgi:hypothetical protein